jgi:hypothetical protein
VKAAVPRAALVLASLVLSASVTAMSTSAAAEAAPPSTTAPLAPAPLVVAAPPPDPSDGTWYVGTFAEAGGDFGARGTVGVELGVRPAPRGTWYRARYGTGVWIIGGLDNAGGSYHEAMLGVERRRCGASGLVCVAFALDAGLLDREHDEYVDISESVYHHAMGASVHPRAGVELGGPLRLRLAATLPVTYIDNAVSVGFLAGASILLGN